MRVMIIQGVVTIRTHLTLATTSLASTQLKREAMSSLSRNLPSVCLFFATV